MTSDPKGEYDAPLYGPLDNRDALIPIVILAAMYGSFLMGVIVGRAS
jgi:hypothetical protein